MTDLTGKVALITGAARGQGRAHALTLAHHGADVIALDIDEGFDTIDYEMATADELTETVRGVEKEGRRALDIAADVRSQDELDRAVERGIAEFGHIDILVANAGIYGRAPFWELTEDEWNDMIDVNLGGAWRSAKAVTPHMIERESGSIVMTSSVNGLEPGPEYAHYTASKHGVLGLMGTVALELAPYGVRCNAVCPGAIDTPMVNWQGAYDMFAGHEDGTRRDLEEGALQFHALKGAGVLDPQVVADAVLWLVSDSAARVTGVALPVDAGHMVLPRANPEPAQ